MLRRLLLVAAAMAVVGQSAWGGDRPVTHARSQSPERMATPDIEVLVKQAVEDRFGAKRSSRWQFARQGHPDCDSRGDA